MNFWSATLASRIRVALRARAGTVSASERALMDRLAEEQVLVPEGDRAAGEGSGSPGAVPVPVIRHREEGPVVPVFTSEEAMARALPYVPPYQRVRLGILAALWPADDVSLAVDPGSPREVTIHADDVQALFGLRRH